MTGLPKGTGTKPVGSADAVVTDLPENLLFLPAVFFFPKEVIISSTFPWN